MNPTAAPRIGIIGAGPSGLTAAKNFLAQDFAVRVFERHYDIGGIWNSSSATSSVYASAHLISSKRQTEFLEFPMPDEYPPYPSRRQALDYLQAYARHYDLYQHIEFGRTVTRVRRDEVSWIVHLADESEPQRFSSLVVANGHHAEPLYPSFAGTFTGQVMHAHDYKTPEVLKGRRVLVVGAGNSGCDIAVEAAQHADLALLSMRRGYHFLPKFLRGKPIDVCGETLHRWGFPLWLRRAIAAVMIRIAVGPLENYGLPRPDHRLFETHPIINSQLLYELGHGHIRIKPNIERLDDGRVHFVDGSQEEIDLIIYATGYQVSFPFLDRNLLLDERGQPRLYLNAFHPERDDLFVAGLIQPDSGLWGLADLQCRIMAHYLRGLERNPSSVAWFQRLKARGRTDLGHGVRYIDSPRHALEVEYFGYRRKLKQILRRFGDKV